MKKYITLVYALVFLIIFSPQLAKAVDSVVVSQCTLNEHQWKSTIGNKLTQGFRPEFDTLTGIKLWLGGSGKVNWQIIALEDNNRVLTWGVITINAPGSFSANFNPVSIYPGDHYAVIVQKPTNNGSWAYSSSQNCLPGINYALVNGQHVAGLAAFNFVVYGYNAPEEEEAVADPEPEPEPAAPAPVPDEVIADNSQAAPNSEEASSLKADSTLSDSTTGQASIDDQDFGTVTADENKPVAKKINWLLFAVIGAGVVLTGLIILLILTLKKRKKTPPPTQETK